MEAADTGGSCELTGDGRAASGRPRARAANRPAKSMGPTAMLVMWWMEKRDVINTGT